tara:strand:- start:1828 stop:3189 length:1362 start_codon:yes stop_codon:yes gene_type:complete
VAYRNSYLNSRKSRRKGIGQKILMPLFIGAILATNYWVFVYDSAPEVVEYVPERSLSPLENQPTTPTTQPEEESPQRKKLDRIAARVLKGSIQSGEILGRKLADAKIIPEQYRPVIAALDPLVDFRRSLIGDTYRVDLNQEGKILRLQYKRSPIELYEAKLSKDGTRYLAEKVDVPIEKQPLRIGCLVDGTLYESLARCVEDPKLASHLIKLLSFDLRFYEDVRTGDVVRFIGTKELVDGRFFRYGPIKALEYQGKFNTLQLFHHGTGNDISNYYKADGSSVQRDFLRSPLQFTRVSSGYQERRYHPVLHKYKQHLAIDYAAPLGTPVWTVGDGEVVWKRRRGPSGNLVVVRHSSGYKTYYAHLHRYASRLRVGQKVKQGQIIGFVGATGRATGPHLHFALKKGNRTLNPLEYDGRAIAQVPKQDRDAFDMAILQLMDELQKITAVTPVNRSL